MTKYSALLKTIAELEAKVGQKFRPSLWLVVNEGDDPAAAQSKAVAEWLASHPKAKARGTEDFDWIIWDVVKPPKKISPDAPPPAPSPSAHAWGDDDGKAKWRGRRLVYPPSGWV
jgi:hypothetical protein